LHGADPAATAATATATAVVATTGANIVATTADAIVATTVVAVRRGLAGRELRVVRACRIDRLAHERQILTGAALPLELGAQLVGGAGCVGEVALQLVLAVTDVGETLSFARERSSARAREDPASSR
jgi:hypothetical protein